MASFRYRYTVKKTFFYLLAVVSCVFHTRELSVRPAIQVGVLSADVTISSIAWFTFTVIQDVGEDAQIDAVSFLIAGVCSILAWVSRRADLRMI